MHANTAARNTRKRKTAAAAAIKTYGFSVGNWFNANAQKIGNNVDVSMSLSLSLSLSVCVSQSGDLFTRIRLFVRSFSCFRVFLLSFAAC